MGGNARVCGEPPQLERQRRPINVIKLIRSRPRAGHGPSTPSPPTVWRAVLSQSAGAPRCQTSNTTAADLRRKWRAPPLLLQLQLLQLRGPRLLQASTEKGASPTRPKLPPHALSRAAPTATCCAPGARPTSTTTSTSSSSGSSSSSGIRSPASRMWEQEGSTWGRRSSSGRGSVPRGRDRQAVVNVRCNCGPASSPWHAQEPCRWSRVGQAGRTNALWRRTHFCPRTTAAAA